MVRASFRDLLPGKSREPGRVGVVAVALEVHPIDAVGVIAHSRCVVDALADQLARGVQPPEEAGDDTRRREDFPPHGWCSHTLVCPGGGRFQQFFFKILARLVLG